METIAASVIAKGTASGWTLCVLALVGIVLLARIYAGQRPKMKEMELDSDAAIRGEYAAHLETVKADVDRAKADVQRLLIRDEDKGRRLTIAETRISQQDSQIGQLRFLIKLINDELERKDPGNPIARQARNMMDVLEQQTSSIHANAEETGHMADVMSKLCVTKGTDE